MGSPISTIGSIENIRRKYHTIDVLFLEKEKYGTNLYPHKVYGAWANLDIQNFRLIKAK